MPFFRIKTPTRDERGSLPFALLTIVLTASLSVTTMSALSLQSTKQNVAMNQIKENSARKTAVARATEQISQFKTYAKASKEVQQRGETLTPLQWCEQLASGQEWSLASGRAATPSQVNGDSQDVETRVSGTSKQAQINSQKFTRWSVPCGSEENSPESIENGFLTAYVETGKKNNTGSLLPSDTRGIGQSLYPTQLWDGAPLGPIVSSGESSKLSGGSLAKDLPFVLYRTTSGTPEESLVKRVGPHGEEVVVFETNSVGSNSGIQDVGSPEMRAGGWYGPRLTRLGGNQTYRISMWIKRPAGSVVDTLYIGGTGDICKSGYVFGQSCLAATVPSPANAGFKESTAIPTDEWVLAVLYIYPPGRTTQKNLVSGMWKKDGTRIPLSAESSNLTFLANSKDAKFTLATFVSSKNAGVSYQFYNPRIDELDGSEPEISKLLNPPPPEEEMVATDAQKIIFKDGKVFYSGSAEKGKAEFEEPDAVE